MCFGCRGPLGDYLFYLGKGCFGLYSIWLAYIISFALLLSPYLAKDK